MKILIIKTSALGDIIHALPVLDYLHQVKPGIEVDWVVEEPFRELLEGHPQIANLFLVRTKVWRKRPLAASTISEVRELKKKLASRSYDLVFDIQGNLKSSFVCWLSGCDDRIGFSQEFLQERINLFFTTRQIAPRRQDQHITDQCLRLVSVPFGKDFRQFNLSSEIYTSPDDDAAAEALLATLSDGLIFLFHCGTTWETKFWHEESWITLGRRLLETHPDSSLLLSWGNETERETAVKMAEAIGPGARITARYTLKGLTALLKKVDLVFGGDTGPVHIAAAVGTPTVSLYRSSDGKRSGPRGNGHVIVQSPYHCTRCFKTRCDRDRECRSSITVDMMMKGAEKLLSSERIP